MPNYSMCVIFGAAAHTHTHTHTHTQPFTIFHSRLFPFFPLPVWRCLLQRNATVCTATILNNVRTYVVDASWANPHAYVHCIPSTPLPPRILFFSKVTNRRKAEVSSGNATGGSAAAGRRPGRRLVGGGGSGSSRTGLGGSRSIQGRSSSSSGGSGGHAMPAAFQAARAKNLKGGPSTTGTDAAKVRHTATHLRYLLLSPRYPRGGSRNG